VPLATPCACVSIAAGRQHALLPPHIVAVFFLRHAAAAAAAAGACSRLRLVLKGQQTTGRTMLMPLQSRRT
jgi:hypothetical protein